MINEFANRQNMHLAVLALLADPAHQPVWKDKKPVLFTTRAAALGPKVAALTGLISGQQADTTGHAADKDREEEELEAIAHEIGETLAGWFEDQGNEAEAAQIDLSFHAWQRLRDTALIAKAKLLHGKLTSALATDAAALLEYGLDPADATQLAKETDDFEKLVATPAAAISGRKALTKSLRPSFREVSELLGKMDRLVLRFRKTPPGALFAEAWKAARNVRDLGQAAPTEPAPPTP
ncbi:MAG: hypothetical protein ABIS50_03985 [Luteolibacter sp.]|uniref:hypothetical protein n=1 Tax=Luteolibacter sp. TaxID=1962973 RepID=UPI003264560D